MFAKIALNVSIDVKLNLFKFLCDEGHGDKQLRRFICDLGERMQTRMEEPTLASTCYLRK